MAAVTIKRIEAYLENEADRKELNRKAKLLEREGATLKKEIRAMLEKNKGKPITKGAYTLSLKTKAGRVSWKDHFIARLGAKIAEKITKAEPETTFVDIS